MNLKEIDLAIAESRQRLALLRAQSKVPGTPARPFGYFEMDMFECPPFIMFSNGDAPTVEYIVHEGTFEPCSMALWCRLAKTATGILDIGANIGIYGLAAAKLRPDVKVHAFEPNPYAYARLRMHKYVNDLPNLVEHPVAVHRQSGVTMLKWLMKPDGNISSGGALNVESDAPLDSAPVRVEPIDGTGLAATLGTRPLVKVDVEGAESVVFAAMKEVLALRPDIILETFDPRACEGINTRLLPMGYSVYSIHEKSGTLRPKPGLTPCDLHGHDYNQFLTVRPHSEIQGIINVA